MVACLSISLLVSDSS